MGSRGHFRHVVVLADPAERPYALSNGHRRVSATPCDNHARRRNQNDNDDTSHESPVPFRAHNAQEPSERSGRPLPFWGTWAGSLTQAHGRGP
ncbi:MAG: hypothetical protein QOC92_513, partial [Acidimicrobiaceae bacterium]